MNLNDLLIGRGIDAEQVLVLPHRPREPGPNKVLPWLAAEKPDVFNAYQQTQGKKLEKTMKGAGYLASFIGHEPGKPYLSACTRSGRRSRSLPSSSGGFRPTSR